MSAATVCAPEVTPRWINYAQAARYVGLSPQTLRRLVAKGALRVSRPMPGVVRFDVRELDAMMRTRE